jgi:gas vesicle protein GvpN
MGRSNIRKGTRVTVDVDETLDPPQDSLAPEASDSFVETPAVKEICERALAYLRAGYPVHFSGPAGTGKTTLAFHVASQLGRPVTLIHGDDDFGSADLVGSDSGYRKRRCVDNYIHSVLKTEEEMSTLWADNRLTYACRQGNTLIYDEFTRSRPETNNVLLSVLEERLLTLPTGRRSDGGYIEVHPGFHAILTSNPEEYAGVHRTQDALMDRLIGIRLDHFDRETEVKITMAKSGLARGEAETIVDLVRQLREFDPNHRRPSIRGCIMVARVLAQRRAHVRGGDPIFETICRDVLKVDTGYAEGESLAAGELDRMLLKLAARTREAPEARPGRAKADAAASGGEAVS